MPVELWKVLGTELGIDMDTLNAIEEEHSGDDRKCLHAMIDNTKPPITRGVMKRVLRTQSILSGVTGIISFSVLKFAPHVRYWCSMFYSTYYVCLCLDPPLAASNLKIWFKLKWEHYLLWKVIGEELGIDADTLNSIEWGQTTTASDYLHRMIDEAKPPITHDAMARALQSQRVTNAIAGI